MMKGLVFFCCACVILIFSMINLSIGPIVNRSITNYIVKMNTTTTSGNNGGTLNCKYLSDVFDKYKKEHSSLSDKEKKYFWKRGINECNRRKAFHNMEYTAFIFDIVIGFVCGLLGLFHHFEVKKEFVLKTGLIGLGCGVVGFVLTLVYVIYNGLVYTNYYDYYSTIYKRDGDGAFAEKKGNNFECFYYDEPENVYSIYAKYSDLNKKQYNYDKDLIDSYTSGEASKCTYNPAVCLQNGKIPTSSHPNCQKLYVPTYETEISNKDKSDRFLTTLILSLFVCLANIGLAVFGFLLFRTPNDF